MTPVNACVQCVVILTYYHIFLIKKQWTLDNVNVPFIKGDLLQSESKYFDAMISRYSWAAMTVVFIYTFLCTCGQDVL